MNDKPAAAFVRIKNRLINLVAICSVLYHEGLSKLVINFGVGDRVELKEPDEIEYFLAQIAPYELAPVEPPPIPEPTGTAPPADDQDPETEDDPGDTDSDDGDDGEETATDDDQLSALEMAGLPADLAALLHAGGIDTVEAALAHPDLTEIEDIGTGRRDKILKILKT